MEKSLAKVKKFNIRNIFCKIKNIIDFKNMKHNFFSRRPVIILFGIIILLKTILFYKNTVFYKEDMWGYTVRQSTFFIVIGLFFVLFFRRPKTRFYVLIGIDFFISFILFADEMYYNYASNIISVMQAGNLQYMDEIISAIPSLLNIHQVLYFIDIVIMLIFAYLDKIKLVSKKDFKKTPVIITLIFIIISLTYYHFIPEALDLVTGFIYNKKSSVRYGSIYAYHVVDVMNAVTNKKSVQYTEYEELINAYNEFKNEQNQIFVNNVKFDSIAKGKNIIAVQLEAAQNFVIDKTINGKEITPNLNKFLRENVKLTNMHSASYTTTADSEHSYLSSIYPTENGEAFSKYYSNTYNDIYSELKTAGYTNIYAHGNYANFWNRKNVYSKLDVDKTYFVDDFEDKSEYIRTYLSDELLYRQMISEVKNANYETPFYLNLVAASSHKPFDLEGIVDKEKKVTIDIGKYKGTYLGDYLESMNYMDYAFGIFIDELKKADLYEDTVIIVFGDHYGMTMYDENLLEFLGEDIINYNDARMQYEFSNVAAGIRIPGVSNLVIDTPTNKIDLKPTLMQICGIEDEFSIGCSIFKKRDYTCINNGKIITNDYLYDGNWYELETGKQIDLNTLSEEEKQKLDWYVEKMEQELGISKSVVVNNLLKGKF